MMYRGIIHFHSNYSFDSIMSIKKIVDFALKNELNFLCLTDHNTIKGSVALKEYIGKNNIDIEVIIGAEYKTNLGDIIVLGIENEMTSMNFDMLIKDAREQNAIILFPHPYKGHKKINHIASNVDMIEIFNSRVENKDNYKAKELAKQYNKKIYYASDAHTSLSLHNVILEFENKGCFLNSLISSDINLKECKNSFYIEILFSQYIKSFKYKSIKIFLSQIKTILKWIITLKIVRRIS